ncbi:CocE/NonD family hydrolase [Streptomyces sp. Da 82-17]|uniref:CocE/NonD family hydrolase n=1 Tax=Streptomyces sp. Da 82-17 TaxID=3377116 RepID=UPI0038D4451D
MTDTTTRPAEAAGPARRATVRATLLAAPDGTALAADLALPAGPGPFPAVLIRTPYDRRRHRSELRAWAGRGFAAVSQDVRGRHGSQGSWRPYRDEAGDGGAALGWIRRQPWSDGRVLASGASYGAHCALALADGPERADAVIAAVPALGPAETAREAGGPERLYARAGWWAAHGDRPDSDEAALDRALHADPALLEHLPLRTLPDRLGRPLPSWPGLWADHNPYQVPADGVPLLAVGGTHDPFAEDTLRLWRAWNGPARLLLGPWGHALTADPGADARPAHKVGLGGLYVAWARAALDGALSAGRGGVVGLGCSELWLPARELCDEPTSYGLAGMKLLRGPAFRADPARPVRSDRLDVPRTGAPDRCLLVTPPLPRPLDLLGRAAARLRVTADTPCADWVVRVVAVTVDDTAEPLATGIARESEPTSGGFREVEVGLGHVARRLPAGTRLRVEVAGHHFPAHARNPHTGEDPVTATRLLPSERTVDLGASALLLPVVPPRHLTHAATPHQELRR